MMMGCIGQTFCLEEAFRNNGYWCRTQISAIFIDLTCSGILHALGIKGKWKTISFKKNQNVFYAVRLKVSNSDKVDKIYLHYHLDKTFMIYAIHKGRITETKMNLLPGEIINNIYYLLTGRITSFVNVF